jgi:hypothetical protein
VVAAWALAALVSAVVGRHRSRPSTDPALRRLAAVSGLVAVGGLVVVGVAAARPLPSVTSYAQLDRFDASAMAPVTIVSDAIERSVPRGPVVYKVRAHGLGGYASYLVTEGVAWRLEADGWRPGTYAVVRDFTGLAPEPNSACAVVTLDGTRVSSIARTGCRPGR